MVIGKSAKEEGIFCWRFIKKSEPFIGVKYKQPLSKTFGRAKAYRVSYDKIRRVFRRFISYPPHKFWIKVVFFLRNDLLIL